MQERRTVNDRSHTTAVATQRFKLSSTAIPCGIDLVPATRVLKKRTSNVDQRGRLEGKKKVELKNRLYLHTVSFGKGRCYYVVDESTNQPTKQRTSQLNSSKWYLQEAQKVQRWFLHSVHTTHAQHDSQCLTQQWDVFSPTSIRPMAMKPKTP